MSTFPAHGTVNIVTEGNLILIEAEGLWNIEYLDYLHEELIKAISQVDKNNYAALITLTGEAISVDKGVEYHLNFIRQGNIRAVALNLACCSTASLTKNMCIKLYRAAGIKHAFFDNNHEARLWLEHELKLTAAM